MTKSAFSSILSVIIFFLIHCTLSISFFMSFWSKFNIYSSFSTQILLSILSNSFTAQVAVPVPAPTSSKLVISAYGIISKLCFNAKHTAPYVAGILLTAYATASSPLAISLVLILLDDLSLYFSLIFCALCFNFFNSISSISCSNFSFKSIGNSIFLTFPLINLQLILFLSFKYFEFLFLLLNLHLLLIWYIFIFNIVLRSKHFIWQILLFYVVSWIIMWVFVANMVAFFFHSFCWCISYMHWYFACIFICNIFQSLIYC